MCLSFLNEILAGNKKSPALAVTQNVQLGERQGRAENPDYVVLLTERRTAI
jgi:hypothetical protein